MKIESEGYRVTLKVSENRTIFVRKVFKPNKINKHMKPKYVTVANGITLSRIVFALISVILMVLDKWVAAFIFILVAIGLDFIDGKVARKMHEASELGTFLDIMVDKIIFISSFLMIGVHINMIFFYIGLLVLMREYTMDTMRAIAASNNKVIPADKLSKTKGTLYGTSILVMIGNRAFISNTAINTLIQQIGIGIITVAVVFAYFALIRFLVLHRKVLEISNHNIHKHFNNKYYPVKKQYTIRGI